MGNINSNQSEKPINSSKNIIPEKIEESSNKSEETSNISEENNKDDIIFKKMINISNNLIKEYNKNFLDEDFCNKIAIISNKKMSNFNIKLLKSLNDSINSPNIDNEFSAIMQYIPKNDDKFYNENFKDELIENFWGKNMEMNKNSLDNIELNIDIDDIISTIKYKPGYINYKHVNNILEYRKSSNKNKPLNKEDTKNNSNKIQVEESEKKVENINQTELEDETIKVGGMLNNRNKNNNNKNNNNKNNNNKNNKHILKKENDNNQTQNSNNNNNNENNQIQNGNNNEIEKENIIPIIVEKNFQKVNKIFRNNKKNKNEENLNNEAINNKTNQLIIGKKYKNSINDKEVNNIIKYSIPKNYKNPINYCKNNEKCMLTKKELCQSITQNFVVRNNIIAAILTTIPYKNQNNIYEGGICYQKFINLDLCKVCVPYEFRELRNKDLKDIFKKILEKADYLTESQCRQNYGYFLKLSDNQKKNLINNIKKGSSIEELKKINPKIKHNIAFLEITQKLKKNYFDNINILTSILEKISESTIINNVTLNMISNETKKCIDNMYNLCHYYYIYGIIALINSDLKEDDEIEEKDLDIAYSKILK
jgi:hypothetical protein